MDREIIKLQTFVDTSLSDRGAIKVLEAGCGSHSNIKMPENTPSYLVGIDISEEQLQMNSVVNEKIVGDIQSYVLPSSEFDVIVCWWVLEHVSHPEKALDNFLHSMKEDGILILAVPNVLSIKGLITKYTPHWFHIWVHRSFWKFFSIEGFTPFRTYLKFSISPVSIRRYAAKNGLSIEYSSLYESQAVREFRGKHKIVNIGWWLLIQTFKVLSFGKFDAEPTEFMIVLKKKKGSYDYCASEYPLCSEMGVKELFLVRSGDVRPFPLSLASARIGACDEQNLSVQNVSDEEAGNHPQRVARPVLPGLQRSPARAARCLSHGGPLP